MAASSTAAASHSASRRARLSLRRRALRLRWPITVETGLTRSPISMRVHQAGLETTLWSGPSAAHRELDVAADAHLLAGHHDALLGHLLAGPRLERLGAGPWKAGQARFRVEPGGVAAGASATFTT